MGGRAKGPSGFSTPRQPPSSLLLLGFSFLERGIGVEGNGCSRWSVAGGDDGELVMDARKTVPTVAAC